MDGIDGVMIDLSPSGRFQILAHQHHPFDTVLRQSLFDLNTSGPDEVHRAALAANALARSYAQVVVGLRDHPGLSGATVLAVGAHGQTIRHRPSEFDGIGYTIQLLNGALLAELVGLDVVCDFRSRDVAAGGQGAPLVPAFHRAAFSVAGQDIAVLNLGGIANITFLHADGRTSGHDCGPGNVLLDAWCNQQNGTAYDDDGRWAASGQPSPALLAHLMLEPYLQRLPPKSTGRDLFNIDWLHKKLQTAPPAAATLSAQDVQSTLAMFTVKTAVQDLHRHMPKLKRLMVCGGGALNSHLLSRFKQSLPEVETLPIQQASAMQPMQIEAAAFAWLAWAFLERRTGNCVDVTGAKGPRLLGVWHPA